MAKRAVRAHPSVKSVPSPSLSAPSSIAHRHRDRHRRSPEKGVAEQGTHVAIVARLNRRCVGKAPLVTSPAQGVGWARPSCSMASSIIIIIIAILIIATIAISHHRRARLHKALPEQGILLLLACTRRCLNKASSSSSSPAQGVADGLWRKTVRFSSGCRHRCRRRRRRRRRRQRHRHPLSALPCPGNALCKRAR